MLQQQLKSIMPALVFIADGQIETRFGLIRLLPVKSKLLSVQRAWVCVRRNSGEMSLLNSAGRRERILRMIVAGAFHRYMAVLAEAQDKRRQGSVSEKHLANQYSKHIAGNQFG